MNKFTDIEWIIDDLLEKALYAYPAERAEKIRKMADAVWNGPPDKDRISYIYSGTCPPRDMPELPKDATVWQAELVTQLQMILDHSEWGDDFYPALNPGCSQITIPSYFGCKEVFASGSSKVGPIVNAAGEVYHLPEPGFIKGTAGFNMLEKMRYFRARTRGSLPLYITDIQGPFSVASQVWGIEDFLLAIYENPEEVHYLLRKCTEAVIQYYRLMTDAAEGDLIHIHCMPLMWFPKEKGAAVSEDLLAVVSADAADEFIRPNLEHIAEEFGGVLVHSCGSINHMTGMLNRTKGLVGVNCASTETDIEALTDQLDQKLKLISHNSPVCCKGLPLYNQLQHIALCKKVFGSGRINGVCVVNPWNANPDPVMDAKAYRKMASF